MPGQSRNARHSQLRCPGSPSSRVFYKYPCKPPSCYICPHIVASTPLDATQPLLTVTHPQTLDMMPYPAESSACPRCGTFCDACHEPLRRPSVYSGPGHMGDSPPRTYRPHIQYAYVSPPPYAQRPRPPSPGVTDIRDTNPSYTLPPLRPSGPSRSRQPARHRHAPANDSRDWLGGHGGHRDDQTDRLRQRFSRSHGANHVPSGSRRYSTTGARDLKYVSTEDPDGKVIDWVRGLPDPPALPRAPDHPCLI